MKLAMECPTSLLDQIQPFADFDWVLANLMLTDETYAAYYRESTNLKFLDNGVTETGEPVELDQIAEIAEDIKATYIVARDWIGDYQKTIEGYYESIKKLPKEKVVGVLQGSTPLEALKCLQHYTLNNIVLVPYHVGGSDRRKDSWLMALKRALVVSNIPSDRGIHLLGFTTLEELEWYVARPNVLSMDTDVPVKAGLAVQDIDDFDRGAKVDSAKWDKSTAYAVARNIALLRKAMG